MELFQLKISDQGKIIEQGPSKVTLDDRDIMKSVREVSDTSDDYSPSSNGSQRNSQGSLQGQNNYNYTSPRNVTPPPLDLGKSQKSDEKPKMAFTRKIQNNVEEANPVSSPLRRPKGSGNLK